MRRPFSNIRPIGPFVSQGIDGQYIIDIREIDDPQEEALFTFFGRITSGGRVTIPKALRESYNISSGDTLNVIVEYRENQSVEITQEVTKRNRILIPPVAYEDEGDEVKLNVLEVIKSD